MNKKTELQKNWKKITAELQARLNNLSKEAKVLSKKTEAFIHDVSVKGKAATEAIVLKVKREQLYNQLGRAAAKSSKGNKKINKLRKDISALNKQISLKERRAR